MSSGDLNRYSVLVFALLRILEAVRDVLSKLKGDNSGQLALLEETSTRLKMLVDENHKNGQAQA